MVKNGTFASPAIARAKRVLPVPGEPVIKTPRPGAGPNSFGHPGAGGALAFADPDAQLGFSYVMNAMQFNFEGDPRSMALVEAAYACLP